MKLVFRRKLSPSGSRNGRTTLCLQGLSGHTPTRKPSLTSSACGDYLLLSWWALASFLPKNTQDWSPLGWTGWISLQSKGLSRVFSNGQEEKGMTEDEMAGWHHRLDGRDSEWTLGVGDGQGGLACCDSWGRKESDTTKRLNWTELTNPD